jgi:group I intron endonuclease
MIVYKITNKINNKIYFGITKCSLKKRWNEHKCKSKQGKTHLSKSILKYGIENFNIEIVKKCISEDEMYLLEIKLIKIHKTNNPVFGYNNSTGGEFSSKGKKLSIEAKNKISNFQKNRIRKPHSEETKRLISLSAKNRDMSELWKKSAEKRKGKKSHNVCPVLKYSLNGDFIERFESFKDASKNVNGTPSAFTAIKRGRLKTYKNYIWKFEN